MGRQSPATGVELNLTHMLSCSRHMNASRGILWALTCLLLTRCAGPVDPANPRSATGAFTADAGDAWATEDDADDPSPGGRLCREHKGHDHGHSCRHVARVAAAGDISPAGLFAQQATSDLIAGAHYDAVLVLGDSQYDRGELANFNAYFDPTWGRFKRLIHPVPGNHEYFTTNATGYYEYFGRRAGDPQRGYYSFDLGSWHVVALNSNDGPCSVVSCDPSSEQLSWLKADLARNRKKCLLAFWHHPRFSSGSVHGDNPRVQAFWDTLYAARADIVLNGHDHLYERFDPQTPTGSADPEGGIRQFIVGTGGMSHHPFATPKPNSVARDASSFGVLRLELGPASYDWKFLPAEPSSFNDEGHGTCHHRPKHDLMSLP